MSPQQQAAPTAQTPPTAKAPPTAQAKAPPPEKGKGLSLKGKKGPIILVLLGVGGICFITFAFLVWKLFLINHTERYTTARETIEADWSSFIASMYVSAYSGTTTEEEVLEEFETLLSDSRGELSGAICWRVEKALKDDCKNLKNYLGEAEDLTSDVKKIYEREQEDEKEDELEEMEEELSEYVSDISEILATD